MVRKKRSGLEVPARGIQWSVSVYKFSEVRKLRVFRQKEDQKPIFQNKAKYLFFSLIILIFSCSRSKPETDRFRYVVTSPEIAEIISAIQGTQNIAGVTIECDFPLALKNKPKVGTFGRIDIEKILKLDPDIVFTTSLEQDAISDELRKLEVRTIQAYPRSITEMLASIRSVGKKIGEEKRADFMADSLKMEIDALPENSYSPSVYLEIYGNPLMSCSADSFVGELIKLAGGRNIFPQLPREYSRIKPEKVIEAEPEIIIITYPGVGKEQIKSRKGWEGIAACRNDRIYTIEDIDPDLILRASPRVLQGIYRLQELFENIQVKKTER